MRLIDADNLKSLFDTRTWQGDMMITAVDNSPTAYDVDKVVEQIEDIAKDERIRFADQVMRRAVKIVKGGGRDE